MDTLKWHDSYSVGDDHLDEQHRGLILLINRLDSGVSVPTALDELQIYVDEHFREEERMLEAVDYPDLAAHKRQHAAFEEWLEASRQACRSGEVVGLLRESISSYLKTWLVNHILVSDKAYSDYLD
ncbi:MAG: hemerythrin family protein [Rhodospirillales bacterium]|nr:MAG: hemerythrin family protein [Rhodospirillales bacterium]